MDFYEVLDHVIDLLKQRGKASYRALKLQSLNFSQFVEDQNGPSIGQTLPFSLCWQLLGLAPPARSTRPARTHSVDERSAGIERSPHIPASYAY
jgi:hypothetical protein